MALSKRLAEFGNHLRTGQQRKYISLGELNSNGGKLVGKAE